MMFLNVMLAGFVVLGAIPIIIHLLNKQRFRVVEWAAIQFLLKTLQKNSRRLQMRDLILLILRTCAIIFAALALARPTIAPGRFTLLGGGGAISAVVVLDNSRSMGYREGTETRWAQAKARAKAVVDQLPKGSRAALVLMSDIASAEITDTSQDLTFVNDTIDKSQLSDGGTSISSGLGKAWEILKKADGAREIYLITDLQANAWPSADDAGWRAMCGDFAQHHDLRLFLAQVGSGGIDDLSVDGLEASDPLVTTDSDTSFAVTVRNHGHQPVDNVEVQLLVDDGKGGDLRPSATAAIDHLDGIQQVMLQTRFETGGRHRIEAKIGPDHLEADNHRYLVQEVIDRLKVLIVDGSSEGGYAGGAAFIRAALAPGSALPEEGAASSLIDAEIITPNALVDTPLDSYQAVILSDVAELTPGEADGLKTFVGSGRALLLFLGANVRPEVYNQLLGDRAGLLPAAIGAHAVEFPGEGQAKGVSFATAGLTHPIVSFFSGKETQPFLAQPRFFQAFPLDLGNQQDPKKAGSAVVLRFSDGSPALVERQVGNGTVLLFASSADRQWSDFPLRPAFLMIVSRAVQHAVLARKLPATVKVHDSLLALLPAKDAGTRLAVLDPLGGKSSVTVNLASDGRTASAEVAETPFAGFWQIGEGASAVRFATNGPPDESVLDTTDRGHIADISAPVQWQWIGADADVATNVSRSRVGREIWPLLIAIAIGCLLSESYLAMHWSPKGALP